MAATDLTFTDPLLADSTDLNGTGPLAVGNTAAPTTGTGSGTSTGSFSIGNLVNGVTTLAGAAAPVISALNGGSRTPATAPAGTAGAATPVPLTTAQPTDWKKWGIIGGIAVVVIGIAVWFMKRK